MVTQKALLIFTCMAAAESVAKQYMFEDTLIDHMQHDLNTLVQRFSPTTSPLKTVQYSLDEKDDRYTIEMRVPGLSKEDFTIAVERVHGGCMITVSAEAKEITTETHEEKKEHRKTVRQHSFSQQIWLDHPIAADRAAAELKDGILTIVLPKVSPSKKQVQHIKIK